MAVNSPEQDLALEMIRQGKNVAIFGAGGVGKSHLIRQILNPNTVLVAPTGIAALNIGGVTAHRTFGLPLGVPTHQDFMQVSRKVSDLFNVMSPVKRIVIDEISCLRLDMLELINSKLQTIRGNNKPFGGLNFVIVGDPFQLSPVITNREESPYYSEYKSPYFFDSDLMRHFEVIELTKVFRQEDKRQVAMLNSIRCKDKFYKHALDTIFKESKPYEPNPDVPVLCCFKADVRNYNYKYFRKLDTPIFDYKARIEGRDEWKDSTVQHNLSLREGAKVMFKANDENGLFVNGETGVVSYLDNVIVKVKKKCGKEVTVLPFTYEKYEYKNKFGVLDKEVISTFTQIPLELAYAQSVHVSQGSQMDEVAIDLGRKSFASGQLYVALSRCRDLRNISFVRQPRYEDVILDKRIKEFYRSLRND